MKNVAAALFVGFIFALGLGISGMTQPGRVIGFLNLRGDWDPTLIFVMMGALMVHAPAYYLIRRRKRPLLADRWNIPEPSAITWRLALGASLFGAGWGLAGFCPAPALTSLVTLSPLVFTFVGTMMGGIFIYSLLERKS